MLSTLHDWLIQQGVSEQYVAAWVLAAGIAGILVLAVTANVIAKRIVVRGLLRLSRHTTTVWDDLLARERVFHRLSHLAPAVVIYLLAPMVLADDGQWSQATRQASLIYMVVVAVSVLNGALNAVTERTSESAVSRDLPVKSFVQVAKLVLFVLTAIAVVSLLIGKSPFLLLSGLGAMTAVVMLVFRDAILGFVAGIQLSANRMVAPGDWIEMPKYGADGDVLEVALTTVKVQNWDKTITTIPTHALISESFRNWRGMSESGGRRIKRAINIDIHSIRFCDEEMLERFSSIQYVADYLRQKQEEISVWNEAQGVDFRSLANGRRLTNIGTFRAYVIAYLRRHPMVHQEMTFLVRQLAPTEHGLPIEIYVFSRDQAWANYEAIQADIFDHILAVVPEFDLRVYQQPSGADVRSALGPARAALGSTSGR